MNDCYVKKLDAAAALQSITTCYNPSFDILYRTFGTELRAPRTLIPPAII